MKEKRKTVLVVDDEEESRELIIKSLSRYLPDVIFLEADDGSTALKIFKEIEIDLVITDFDMPYMLGSRLAGEIRELKPEALIIVITAALLYENEYKELGFNYYFQKPIGKGFFIRKVAYCLGEELNRRE